MKLSVMLISLITVSIAAAIVKPKIEVQPASESIARRCLAMRRNDVVQSEDVLVHAQLLSLGMAPHDAKSLGVLDSCTQFGLPCSASYAIFDANQARLTAPIPSPLDLHRHLSP